MKLRVLDASPTDAQESARELTGRLEDVELVQVIGHVVVLYKPFAENPEIRLPA